MKNILTFILSFLLIGISLSCLYGQSTSVQIGDLKFRNIGPANQGGRIVDIEAHDDDFKHVYAATASGGVWKSNNAGTTWTPIFDDYETASIGDIAIDQSNKNIIWVGTGEANNRNSVSWGNGIYKSTDGGDTFENKGLESTHQIARVLVHPEDSEDVCACAIGHLWGYSGDRGLFRTKDGGDSWAKLDNGLPNDGKTGCIDLVRDAKNADVLYAAFYHRLRQPWHFNSGGGQGGIYKSTDGGDSWTKLSNGLPSGPTGRIGLAIYEKDPNIVMALIEAEKTGDLSRPGSGVYRSEDGGDTWKYINTYNNRPFYYSQIRINPHDDQRVYLLTTSFRVSTDGGVTLTNGSEDQEVHGDFHGMWLDPTDPDRYYLGADKGLSLTHDHGAHFQLLDNLPIAQFYRINYDMQDPYYIYGGLQDNGSYATASFTRDARGILSDSNWKMHWGDGQDSAFNPFDHRDGYSSMENGSYFKYNAETRYMQRISPSYGTVSNYSDHFDADEEDKKSATRFNWSAPLVMSSHDPSTIFIAGNHVYKSTNKGASWKIISPDLSTNDPVKRKQGVSGGVTPDNTGAETHCAVYSLSVSPIDEDIIWAGTDDGNVQCTTDGGQKWMNVRAAIPEVPEGLWVSRVEASHFDPKRAYVTFDGHRSDDFGTWVFVTDDNGKSWRKITTGITEGETVRVIREDHKNPNLLFIGTETGVWLSVDRGMNWSRLKAGLPTVSVYDIKIHPRENDLIIGTHGRSLWVMDDISPLQDLSRIEEEQDVVLFDQKDATLWNNVSRGGQRGHFWFAGENPPSVVNNTSIPRAGFLNTVPISFHVSRTDIDSVQLIITDRKTNRSMEITTAVHPGVNRYNWDRRFESKAFTVSEKEEIESIFQEVMNHNSASSIKRYYNRWLGAETPYEQRRAIMPLTSSYLSYAIPEEFGIPMAEVGTYEIILMHGDQVAKTTVSIREDPMKSD